MAQVAPRRETILEAAEALDSVVRESDVPPLLRDLSGRLVAAAEREAWRLKTIADLANHGQPTRDTRRWEQQLAGALTDCAGTQTEAIEKGIGLP